MRQKKPQNKKDVDHRTLQSSSSSNESTKVRKTPELLEQNLIGNHGTLRRIGADIIQPKLKVSPANDRYEQEANKVADMVVGMPNLNCLQQFPDQNETLMQRQTATPSVVQSAGLPESVRRVLRKGRGRPIGDPAREYMEARFGYDFGHVSIHTDDTAANSTKELDARAYTVGTNIVFGANQYNPSGTEGRRMLAHELTHVIQQKSSTLSKLQRTSEGSTRTDLSLENIGGRVAEHLNEYRDHVRSGVDNWQVPDESETESDLWFWISLGWDMVWVGSSLIVPLSGLIYRGGKLIGKLGLKAMEDVSKEKISIPDIKIKLKTEVSLYVDQLKDQLQEVSEKAYSEFSDLNLSNPGAGWLDKAKKIEERREVIWRLLFDEKVAPPWKMAGSIEENTRKDLAAIWQSFRKFYMRDIIVGTWRKRPRYEFARLLEEIQKIFYKALVESGVAERSPGVKVHTGVVGELPGKIFDFPSGVRVKVPPKEKVLLVGPRKEKKVPPHLKAKERRTEIIRSYILKTPIDPEKAKAIGRPLRTDYEYCIRVLIRTGYPRREVEMWVFTQISNLAYWNGGYLTPTIGKQDY